MNDSVLLRTTDLTRYYFRKVETIRALDGIDMTLYRGEHVVITGPSGSGKTTLIQLLAGLDQPTRGFVELAGHRLDRLTEKELVGFRAAQIGFVFQDFGIVRSLTALDNVRLQAMLARIPSDMTPRATELLESFGLGRRLHHLPHQLSRGELQRVAVARALVHRPAVLLADEPTGSLDPQSAGEIVRCLRDLRGQWDVTVVVVTHDANWARQADRQFALRAGSLESPS